VYISFFALTTVDSSSIFHGSHEVSMECMLLWCKGNTWQPTPPLKREWQIEGESFQPFLGPLPVVASLVVIRTRRCNNQDVFIAGP
jgi:hypothetical protein